MCKRIVFIASLILSGLIYSQENYPKDYFVSPLKIPLVLSGTFGELRNNHFHAGFDIKTQKVEGLSVIASADGYVSRINVSLWGYGNAIYITHPNGFTTVYGHLKKFSPKIEEYVKKNQYKKESFTIRLYPKKSDLIVTKGEEIALSGNSGSSGGPHLHYEIRDVKSNILNPMLFGITVPDHKNPTIVSAFTYTKNDSSQVNQSNKSVQLVLKRQYNGDLLANTIYAYGKIGIGLNVHDRLDGALNHNGIYDLKMEVNGKKLFQVTFDKFSFNESRLINSHIDYKKYIKIKQRVQKCFIDHETNNLSLYKNIVNNGFFTIKDSLDYKVTITAKDFKGNKTKLIIPIKGKKDNITITQSINKTPYFFKVDQLNKIVDSVVQIRFPKNIFYEDFYFDYSYNDGIAKLHDNSIPVHNYFRLAFDISKYTEKEIKQMYIAKINKYGKMNYVNTKRKDNTLYTSSKSLGEFTLQVDTKYPSAKAYFKENQWLTKNNTLSVRIHDKGSGIKSFRGEIDGEWILLNFNPKKGILTYDFKDKYFDGNLHTLKIIITDNVDNSTTFTTTFNKKFKLENH
jgi:murein DD-endopeptidase MepM/ murein hydrolase activator NlpD